MNRPGTPSFGDIQRILADRFDGVCRRKPRHGLSFAVPAFRKT